MTTAIDSAWIETFSGNKFHLLDPQPHEILIRDIAHALSMQVRYTGHVKKFLSVAEHSYHVSFRVPSEDALWGLLHDASEAYIADLSRPVKHLTPVGPPYLELEKKIMRAICARFCLEYQMPASVKVADNELLFVEKKVLMSSLSWDFDKSTEDARGLTIPDISLHCWSPEDAESAFLNRFEELVAPNS